MEPNLRILGGAFCVLLAAPACGSNHNETAPDGGAAVDAPSSSTEGPEAASTGGCGAGSTIATGSFNLTYQGAQYGYTVHLPPSYDGTTATPLVLNWHGYTSNASQEEAFTAMDTVADSEGFIIVYPNSPDGSWNAGTCCAFTATSRDDVGFAAALVAQIEGEACVDAKRVYTTGMSNGAFMSYRLGCEHAETFAAIAPVAGKVGIPNCNPSRPVPVLAFHGTADPLVTYDAGTLSGEMPALTVPDTVKGWATRDGCMKGPDNTYQMGDVTCQTWSECSGGAIVTLCSVQGAGHCWPGVSACPYGTSTTDINASQKIGEFFKMFTL